MSESLSFAYCCELGRVSFDRWMRAFFHGYSYLTDKEFDSWCKHRLQAVKDREIDRDILS